MENWIEMSLLALLVIALASPFVVNLLSPEQASEEQEEDISAS